MSSNYGSPSLGISNIVYGRRNLNGRVEYLLDNSDGPQSFQIPEQIVLKRWKAKDGTPTAVKYSGFRLKPNTWKSLSFVFGFDVKRLSELDADQINTCFSERCKDEEFITKNFNKIDGYKVEMLVRALGSEKLLQLLKRHNDPEFPERYGTPDLFLFATNIIENEIDHFRFVEVKRPRERLSVDQINELDFLRNELNLKARVLRLIER